MKNSGQGSANRSFGWGASPQFSRGIFLSPPSGRSPEGGEYTLRSVRDARRARPRLVGGIAASILIHVLVLALWQGGSFAAEGGFGDRLLTMAAADPIEVVQLASVEEPGAAAPAESDASDNARPVPTLDPPELTVRTVRSSRVAAHLERANGSGRLPAAGLASLGGSGDGEGKGDGDGSGGDVYIAPRAKTILRTWKPPGSVIGSEALVRVYTDRSGRSTGVVEFVSATVDEETNREIAARVRSLEYWPASRNGEDVAAWAEISFEFCYDGITAASPASPGFGVGEPCEPEETASRVVVAVGATGPR